MSNRSVDPAFIPPEPTSRLRGSLVEPSRGKEEVIVGLPRKEELSAAMFLASPTCRIELRFDVEGPRTGTGRTAAIRSVPVWVGLDGCDRESGSGESYKIRGNVVGTAERVAGYVSFATDSNEKGRWRRSSR